METHAQVLNAITATVRSMMLIFCCRYRVLAFDHDLLSFQDVYLNNQPVIVITNPKHYQFLSPSHEPVSRITQSTHIR